MIDYSNFFKNKKITVMGLGLNGGALNDIKFLASQGAIVTVTDIKTAEQLTPSVEALKNYPNINLVLGQHQLEDFQTADFILQPGNVPLDSPYLAEARKNNIPIHVSESLFVSLVSGVEIVGVTGTRGKSTITHLLYEILQAGLPDRKVYLGGNVRNVSTLALLEKITASDIVVMELDSWALHGMGEVKISPHLAVFSNFLNDHQNFYRNDMNLYLEDKAQIFLHQTKSDVLVLGEQVENLVKNKYGNKIKSQVIVAPRDLLADWKLKIVGEHNRYNASLAVCLSREIGIDEDKIKAVVENFTGLPGRLEYLGEKNGVKFYNDNNATTPDATIVAVKSFPEFKEKIILIGGGADKELDFTEYGQVVPGYVKKFILFEGSATEKIKKILPADADVVVVSSMDDAFKKALDTSSAGDVILLSPGAASFGVFKNEYDRNDQFVELVNKL